MKQHGWKRISVNAGSAAAVVLACGLVMGQPLRFETSGPPEAGTSVYVRGLVAELSKTSRPANGADAAADPAARAMASLRAIAARELEAGDREGESGSRRIVFAALISESLDAMERCLAAASERAREITADALVSVAKAHESQLSLEFLQLGLRDALGPLMAEMQPMKVAPRAAAASALAKEAGTPAEFVALAELLSQPMPVSFVSTADGLAGALADVMSVVSKRPDWLTTRTHEELRRVSVTAARTAADAEASAEARRSASLRLRSIAFLARAGMKIGDIDGRSRPTTGTAGAAANSVVSVIANSEVQQWLRDDAGEALESLERMREAADAIASATGGPKVKENELIAPLRPAWRAVGQVDDTRAALMEAMQRGATSRELRRSPAVLTAREAHSRRLRDVARFVAANGVIAATADDASKSEAGVKVGFEFAARRLRAAGQDLAKPPLRQAALSQIREISLGLSLFEESKAETSVSGAIAKNGAASAAAVPGVAVTPKAEADWSAMQKLAAALVAELDAAREAWRVAWSDAEGTRGRERDAEESQAVRDVALARLVRCDRLMHAMHDLAWAFATAKAGPAHETRRISPNEWRVSAAAVERLLEGAGERAERVAAALANGSVQDADVEAFRTEYAAALLVGRLARMEASDPKEQEATVLEFASGPADPDDAITARLGDQLAIVSRYAEELRARGTSEQLRTYVNQAAATLLDSALLDD